MIWVTSHFNICKLYLHFSVFFVYHFCIKCHCDFCFRMIFNVRRGIVSPKEEAWIKTMILTFPSQIFIDVQKC